jgi:catechol 2,3-dioxygenase-like lactoylglutathione lyase family enzyme
MAATLDVGHACAHGGSPVKLNHIDHQVNDVQAVALFFERYFAFVLRTNRTSPAIAVLDGEGGMTLVLQRKKAAHERYPEGFHVGFLVDREEVVHAFHARATEDGLQVTPVDRNARGTSVYCAAPGGFAVEVSCRPG